MQAAPRVISAQNAYLMSDMMADVIKRGTGRRALALGRGDIGGKTGTTNEAKDTWFNGFTRNLVATVWVGFDQERPLGESEEGARTALPIWMQFMREALKGVPEQARRDRKSTRLNSSHGYISYAVFCLKKKKMSKDNRLYTYSFTLNQFASGPHMSKKTIIQCGVRDIFI